MRPNDKKEGDVEVVSWDASISRGLYRVFFGWCPCGPPWLVSFNDNEFESLKTLANFETVELQIGIQASIKGLISFHSHHARESTENLLASWAFSTQHMVVFIIF